MGLERSIFASVRALFFKIFICFCGMEKNMENNYKLPVSPPEAHYTVYKLTDPEGKIYIGCTRKPVEERWKKGRNYSRDTPIRNAMVTAGFIKSVWGDSTLPVGITGGMHKNRASQKSLFYEFYDLYFSSKALRMESWAVSR